MQRVHPDEGGALLAGDRGEPCQILEIADAEIALRPQAVELAGDAPEAVVFDRLRQGAFARRRVLRLVEAAEVPAIGIDAERAEQRPLGRIVDLAPLAHFGNIGKLNAVALGEPVEMVAHELCPAISCCPSRRKTTLGPGRTPVARASSAPLGWA